MPLYDYGCKNTECGHIFEDLHKIADPGPSECPKCGHKDVVKLMSVIHGSVELSGEDLKAKIKSDAKKMSIESKRSPNTLANLVGEDKFHQNELLKDKLKKERFD